jgi:acetyltransferase-like isoleucine patch superfamily enzyme
MSGDSPKHAVITDVTFHSGAEIYDQVNLFGCEIGRDTKIDAFVYIEEDVKVGHNCTIRPFAFLPTGVTLEEEVFIGPQVTFTNDQRPSVAGDWELLETVVRKGAAIGAGATIGPGVEIGRYALVGAGAVGLDGVVSESTVVGNPARPID